MEITSLLRVLRSHVTLCVTSMVMPSAVVAMEVAAAHTVETDDRLSRKEVNFMVMVASRHYALNKVR